MATTTALTVVKNKTPNVRNLVKKTDYNAKTNGIENKITTDHNHDKCITTQEFNKLTSENISARLAQENLARKYFITNFVRTTDFHDKLEHLDKNGTSNKNELNELSKKVKTIKVKVVAVFKFRLIWIVPKYIESVMKVLLEARRRW